jgi:hypothetical protein
MEVRRLRDPRILEYSTMMGICQDVIECYGILGNLAALRGPLCLDVRVSDWSSTGRKLGRPVALAADAAVVQMERANARNPAAFRFDAVPSFVVE